MRQIKALWLFMILWASGLHAQDAVTLTHPIAYIGHDHNLYLTDGTTTLPIASDADTAEDTPSVRYSQPRWSPDGSQLVFFQDPIEEGRSLMIMESGSLPQPLVGSSDDVYFENRVLAWSPDSTQIAFVGSYADQFGLIVVSVTDGQVRFVAPTFAPGIGEAGGEDPALSVAAAESGRSPYR